MAGKSKHYDLDIDNTLGGSSASNVYIPSQKAVKEYVDGTVQASKTVITFRVWSERNEELEITDTDDVTGAL